MEAPILNYDKLKGKIKEVFGTQSIYAEKMDLDETTVSKKLNCVTYFTQKEILKTIVLLNLKIEDIPIYFFEEKVRVVEQNF